MITPTEDGWYVDSGGFMWSLNDGEWDMQHDAGSSRHTIDTRPQELPSWTGIEAYGPMTRMLPVAPVEGMLGRDLIADPKPWPAEFDRQ